MTYRRSGLPLFYPRLTKRSRGSTERWQLDGTRYHLIYSSDKGSRTQISYSRALNRGRMAASGCFVEKLELVSDLSSQDALVCAILSKLDIFEIDMARKNSTDCGR